MFNNQYLYNQQPNIDRINAQINELENMKKQIQQPLQPTNLTQNFQISPTNREVIKYANSMDDVQKEYIVGDTPYFSKDLSVVWIKSTNGNIKTYELTEIVPKDEKDIKIEYLQAQIEELKKGILNNESNANTIESITDTDKSKKSTSVSTVSKSNKKSE